MLATDVTSSRTPTGCVLPMLLKMLAADPAAEVRMEAAAALANAVVSGKPARLALLRYASYHDHHHHYSTTAAAATTTTHHHHHHSGDDV